MSKIVCDDCLEYMKKMKDNSVDLVLTDPPYGLKFMGKEWDVLPSVDIWKEALRVLKTGDISPYTRQSEQSFALAKTKVTCHHTGDSGSFSRYFSLDAWWERMFSDPVEVPCPECNGLGVIEASPIKETFKEWICQDEGLGRHA